VPPAFQRAAVVPFGRVQAGINRPPCICWGATSLGKSEGLFHTVSFILKIAAQQRFFTAKGTRNPLCCNMFAAASKKFGQGKKVS